MLQHHKIKNLENEVMLSGGVLDARPNLSITNMSNHFNSSLSSIRQIPFDGIST